MTPDKPPVKLPEAIKRRADLPYLNPEPVDPLYAEFGIPLPPSPTELYAGGKPAGGKTSKAAKRFDVTAPPSGPS